MSSDGTLGNRDSVASSLSTGGHFVAFDSNSNNLVPERTYAGVMRDILVRHRLRVLSLTSTVSPTSVGPEETTTISGVLTNSGSLTLSDVTATLEPLAGFAIRTDLSQTTPELTVGQQLTLTWTLEPDGAEPGYYTYSLEATADGLGTASETGAFELYAPPPELVLPEDFTVYTTDPDGRQVTYQATAHDQVDPEPYIDCDPASGSHFPLGDTIVHCLAGNSSGGQTEGDFIVSVVIDEQAPELTVPDTLYLAAASSQGLEVDYAVTAEDAVDPNPTVSCSPAPGSLFPIGTTLVTCTATDGADNLATGTFVVVVSQPFGVLLNKYGPILMYDYQESYRADSASVMTDNHLSGPHGYANLLKRRSTLEVLASADPAAPVADLSLAHLGQQYRNRATEGLGDFLDAVDNGDPGALPVDSQMQFDATRYHLDPDDGDRVYGRAVRASDGSILLQYWLFYYNNPRTFFGGGSHEGDWEVVQIRLDAAGGLPVDATYSQHATAERCPWHRVITGSSGRPLVYVAEGSHANYSTVGNHAISVEAEAGAIIDGVLPDRVVQEGARGGRPPVQPSVVDVTAPPDWFFWRGLWGGRREQPCSPEGPGRQESKWNDPFAWSQSAEGCRQDQTVDDLIPFSLPAPPVAFSAQRVGNQALISYRLPVPMSAAVAPWMMLVSVIDRDPRVPALTTRRVMVPLAGTMMIPLGTSTPQSVLVTVRARDWGRSAPIEVPIR